MVAMHDNDSPNLRKVERILEESLQMSGVSLKARMLIVRVCDIVTRRVARLAAAGIVGKLNKIGRDGSGGETSRRMKQNQGEQSIVITKFIAGCVGYVNRIY
ncbi:hexokinase-3 [Canna indica]|uniref:Phosphotransferase n=1 Tax=Canna indica TaxID=4628 RepID=A0AAQ3JSL5_9LILI|nr:hexokinase-3 [Canna indica]